MKDINDARTLRGFGDFDLVACVQDSAGGNENRENQALDRGGDVERDEGAATGE